MKTIIVLAAILLTGCATPPAFLANHYNNMDPCQAHRPERAQGYQRPNWCGASNDRVYLYNNAGQPLGYIKK